jgi:hypothetical protein
MALLWLDVDAVRLTLRSRARASRKGTVGWLSSPTKADPGHGSLPRLTSTSRTRMHVPTRAAARRPIGVVPSSSGAMCVCCSGRPLPATDSTCGGGPRLRREPRCRECLSAGRPLLKSLTKRQGSSPAAESRSHGERQVHARMKASCVGADVPRIPRLLTHLRVKSADGGDTNARCAAPRFRPNASMTGLA